MTGKGQLSSRDLQEPHATVRRHLFRCVKLEVIDPCLGVGGGSWALDRQVGRPSPATPCLSAVRSFCLLKGALMSARVPGPDSQCSRTCLVPGGPR